MYTLHYDPFQELRRFAGRRNRGWRGLAGWAPRAEGGGWPLPLDVAEGEDAFAVTASVPGFKPEDIEVTIEDNVLTISARTESAEETASERYVIRERRAGAFRRALRLPENVDVDAAATAYEHGVLTISLPKAEERKAKRLTLTPAS